MRAAVRLQKTVMWRARGLTCGLSTLFKKLQFSDPTVLIPFDRTVETYRFYIRYKTLLLEWAEWEG